VGALTKLQVRDHARALGLQVAEKPDSQEICFIPDGDYAGFVERSAPAAVKAGVVADESGRALGAHQGVHRFTIGQRKGLGVSSSVPLYVLRIEAESGQVTVGPREALEQRSLTASTVTWTGADVPHEWRAVQAQIRHRHRAAAGRVRALPDGRAAFESDEPLSAVTPGQAAVFYDGDLVVGGGWID
jgi:tRNA-specific 2-thiouridylase